jgi:capping protein alpha
MSEEYDEEEAAPPAERLQIADFFIMNSPAGEVDEVVKDVKVLVNSDSDVLTDAKTAEILSNYNVERMEFAKAPDTDEPVIVCGAGKVTRDTFVDPSTGKIHEFDHVTRKFTGTTDEVQTLPENIEAYRSAIARAARDYIAANYTEGKCFNTTYGSDDGKIICCLSAKNVHLGNYWSGSWRSVYQLNVASEGKATLECSVNLGSHYFEDGNVQLHCEKKKSVDIVIGDAKATAAAVAKAIGEYEANFQNSLEELYVNMHRTTFKAMRRFLPPNGQFMTWNINAHNVARGSKKN